jgi:hypothetical protein
MSRKMFFCLEIALLVVFAVILAACKSSKKSDSVAILVVDDFTVELKAASNPAPPAGANDPKNNCVYTSEGQQGFASSGAQGFASSGAFIPIIDQNNNPIPHGQLVYNHVRNDLNSHVGDQKPPITVNEFPIPSSDLLWFQPIEQWKISNSKVIYLVPVDTSNYETTAVKNRIEATVDVLSRAPYSITRFVLNMSFVIMPCNLGYDSNGVVIETQTLLDGYHNMITSTKEISALEQTLIELETRYQSDPSDPQVNQTVRNELLYGPVYGRVRIQYFHNTVGSSIGGKEYTRFSSDELTIWLNSLLDKKNYKVISVAAAGNSGEQYNFPFAPAIFDSVVSASAMGWDPDKTNFDPNTNYSTFTTKTSYSNPGDVMLDGELNYTIKNPADEEMHYFGTSFAAPELSFKEALHLLYGGDVRCINSQTKEILSQPPLGYSDGYEGWNNLLIDSAIDRCPNFIKVSSP